jgi:hypothetical protein
MLIIKENEQKKFKFALEVTGTELKNTSARLVFEDANTHKFFPMSIDSDGICEHDILRDDVLSLTEGRVYLEVIAESVLFTPWEEEFQIERVTPKIEVKETKISNKTVIAKAPRVETKKPIVKESQEPSIKQHPMYSRILEEYKTLLKQNKVSFIMGETKETVAKKKKAIGELYKKYGKASTAILEHFTKTKIDELLIL